MSWNKRADASRDAKMSKMGVSRPGYADGGRTKATTVNVIIAPPAPGGSGPGPSAGPMPVPVPTPPPPMPAPPNPMEALMAAASGGAGGPPGGGAGPMPPMRGGGRAYAKGGSVTADPNVKMDGGSGGAAGRIEKARAYGTGEDMPRKRLDRKGR